MMKNKKAQLFYFTVILLAMAFLSYQKASAVTAPALKEGTYLTGQTLSTWPSWSTLGNSLGQALPTDPINQLAPAGTCSTHTNIFCVTNAQCSSYHDTCVLHDPETGWSVADRRFSFACSKDSYAYRYIVSTTPGVYTVRAHFEDPGLPSGFTPEKNVNFDSGFVSTTIFKINDSSGVCNYDQEISTLQPGVCGDGKLNVGEQCDPAGRIEYANGCVGSVKRLNVCNSACQWVASTTLCSNFSHCGNGVKELGEFCDDGSFLNGKYNHCNTTCTGVSSLGKCGDGTLQPAYEICDPSTGPGYVAGTEKYSLTSKTDSCSWDCQNWGPYCGDTITQTQYGEECDGSQTCSVDGNPGTKVCAGNCQKKDRDAVAWWRFEKLWHPGGIWTTDDSSANANSATCNLATCPVVGTGKYGHGLEFSSAISQRYLNIIHNLSLFATSSVTVEAWIYPTDSNALYQKIVEKKSTGTGYDLEFNASSTAHTVRFNLWNGVQTSVDSNSAITLNTWTHVVGTYQRNGTINTAKIYVNGNLENTNVVDTVEPIMSPSTANLAIGKSSTANTNFFFGSMDEVKIYNRALSAAEIQNNYQSGWFCAATSTPVTPVAVAGSCGDGVVNTSEACDRGSADNGHACTPSYGAPCSYCSADCQNTIEVQPAQYCGNGIIESPEKCDVSGGNIFSAASTTGRTLSGKDAVSNGYLELACADESTLAHTIKKGTKSCADCSTGVVRNCVQCGADVNGVSVDGSVINVLDNPIIDSHLSKLQDPLFAKITNDSVLSLAIGSCQAQVHGQSYEEWSSACYDPAPTDVVSPLVGKVTKNSASPDLVSYTMLNPYSSGNALISSNPVCSTDDNPDNKYRMYVNNDWTRPLNFPVIAAPQSWQYDLVLSPVVSSSVRAHDLRIVTSWVGSGDFYSGVLNPFIVNPEIEGASYCYLDVCASPSYKYATGINYYDTPDSKQTGIWYHGFNSTPGQTSAEAFTIDTTAMSGNTYSFYVRSPSYPIRQFKNTAKLRVDVYLPESDQNSYHFGTPVKTYYFQAATPSDNTNARYWQVFNVNKPTSNLSLSDIIDINTVITGGPTDWKYITLTPGAPTPATPIPISTVLSVPLNLRVTHHSPSYVDIVWDTPASDGGSAITHYEIFRGTSAGAETLYYTTPSAINTYSDSAFSPLFKYYYKVRAVNAIGKSSFSNEISVTP